MCNILQHYVVCNDTVETLRVRQLDTDDVTVLESRCALLFAWRSNCKPQVSSFVYKSSKRKNIAFIIRNFFQKLQVSCASSPDVWYEACELDTCRKAVASAAASESSDAPVTSLVFEVKQLTNMHKQVVIQGQLITANHTTEALEVKVTVGNAKDHRTFALNASTSLPSLFVSDSSAFAVKVRGQGQRVQWSQDVVISDKSSDASNLVMVRHVHVL